MLILKDAHRTAVRALAYSPDGLLLASGSDDGQVKLWDLGSGNLAAQARPHHDSVRALTFSPEGTSLLSAGLDGCIKCLKVPVLKGRTLVQGQGWIWALALSPDGWALAAGSECQGHFWHLARHLEVVGPQITLLGHRWPVNAITFSGQGRHLITGSHDRTVKVWDATWGRIQHTFEGNTDWVRSVGSSRVHPLIAWGCGDGQLSLARLDEPAILGRWRGHQADVVSLAFAPDGRTLLSVSWDGTVRYWDLPSCRERAALNWAMGRIHTVVVAPHGMTAAAAGGEGTVVLWDLDGFGS